MINIVIVAALFSQCMGMPMMILRDSRAKCVSVEEAEGEFISISYDAPDIVVDKNHHNYKTAYLTVNVRPDNRVYNTQLHESPVQSRLKPQTILLEERQGNLTHQFEAEGTAAICFRSSAASEKNPMRFGLTVEHIEMDYAMKEGSGSQKANLDKHLSHMEMEMRRIQTGMDSILNEADFQKDQDHAYHEQFDAMHKATTFWPMMQVCILIATGIVQASHVVKFFQSRRII